MKLLLTSLLVLCIPRAMSLKCKACTSTKSWDDCKEKDVMCTSGMADSCIKAYAESGEVKKYAKYCGIYGYCNDSLTNPTCKSVITLGSSSCTTHCCTRDLCNADSVARNSGIMHPCTQSLRSVWVACAMALLVFQNS